MFLGCPYEFVKCYLDKKNKDEEGDNKSFSDYENDKVDIRKNEENESLFWKDYFIIILLIILGIFFQPLYLMFYVLMGLVEFYRQCGCWVFFAYGN